MHRHVLQAHEDRHAEREPEEADDQPAHEKRPSVDALERLGAQIGEDEIGLAAAVRFGLRGGSFRRRLRVRGRGKRERQHQRGEQNESAELSEHCLPLHEVKTPDYTR